MNHTLEIITRLSREAEAAKPLRSPAYWGSRIVAVLALYAIAAQLFLGLRPDIAAQFSRPAFALEIALLGLLALASILASILAMYPDAYQKLAFLTLPYIVFGLLLCLIVPQFFMPPDGRMILPEEGAHGIECALCIASIALIPSAILFAILRKGASIRQFQAGSFAILAAAALGCLTLRLAEANDSPLHLAVWHYLPTLLFAITGAFIGRWRLKW